MPKKIKILLIVISLVLINGCGFKKINGYQDSIYIKNISISGDNRSSSILKNNILFISKTNGINKYDIDLVLSKNKFAKIKNKKGLISRYNMKLSVNLDLTNTDTNTTIKKTFSRNSDYTVEKIHSATINNEKNTVKNLVQSLSNEIISFIILYSKN